jgi:hypothetical protein
MTTLKTYNEEYLTCRMLRSHNWIIDERTKKRKGGIGTRVLVLGCARCNMTRIDSFNYAGMLLTRSYRQPEGYKLDFKPTLMNLRREFFLRDDREAKKVKR